MGNPSKDPYDDLLNVYEERRKDYLFRLTTDEATFAANPERFGVAKRRGFLKGRGPRPQCSLVAQDEAAVAADDKHYLIVWTDNACLRAGIPEPWDSEDAQAAIARLFTIKDKDAFNESLPIPEEPPQERKTSIGFRPLLRLLRQLTVCGRRDFRAKIRSLLLNAKDNQILAPDRNLLPSSVSIDLVRAAITNGRPGPYLPSTAFGTQESPGSLGSWESPGSLGSWESPGSLGSWEPPGSLGSWESPTAPKPPEPRGGNVLLRPVWDALYTLSWFGDVGTGEAYDVRSAVLALASWIRTGTINEKGQLVDQGATSLIQELFQTQVWVPPKSDRPNYPKFCWPDYTRQGIYWWRTIIRPLCIDQCFLLNETADFHSTDLIRFLNLFPSPDPRIPHYVYTAATLALLWFKYWWDEPPATSPGGAAKQEMTMWSENHQILFGQSQLLAGLLYRNFEFARSGEAQPGRARTGEDHIKEGISRVERWLDLRLKFGFSEWNAPGYYNEDFPPLFNLVDFCNPDNPVIRTEDERTALGRIKVKAAMVLDLMIFDCARFTCRGSFGTTAGRAYWEHKCYGWEQCIGNIIEILFGTRGDYTDTEPAAIALATSTYSVPEALLAIGLDRVLLDQSQPFADRTRVSIDFENAADYKIGFDFERGRPILVGPGSLLYRPDSGADEEGC